MHLQNLHECSDTWSYKPLDIDIVQDNCYFAQQMFILLLQWLMNLNKYLTKITDSISVYPPKKRTLFTMRNDWLQFDQSSGKGTEMTNLWLGYCAFHLGDYQKALSIYQALGRSKTPPEDLASNLACVYFFLGMYPQSEKVCFHTLQYKPVIKNIAWRVYKTTQLNNSYNIGLVQKNFESPKLILIKLLDNSVMADNTAIFIPTWQGE